MNNKVIKNKEKRRVRRQAEEASGEVNRLETAQEAGEKDSPGLGEVVLGKLEDFPEDFPLETF